MNTDNYTFIGPPQHINRWDEPTSTVIPGWEYKVRDGVSGAVVPVFISDATFSKDNLQTLILHELGKLRDAHTLTQ